MDTYKDDDTMTRGDSIQTLAGLIAGISIAMLVTRGPDGALKARPMATQDVEFDGDLWFFAAWDSDKAREIAADSNVCATYADADGHRYVSASGQASVLDDRAKMRELWTPALKIWFEGGVEDANLRLIRIEVDRAEYWNTPGGAVVQLVGFVKKMVTGRSPDLGENRMLRLQVRPGA